MSVTLWATVKDAESEEAAIQPALRAVRIHSGRRETEFEMGRWPLQKIRAAKESDAEVERFLEDMCR
jgi:hypothetical protein